MVYFLVIVGVLVLGFIGTLFAVAIRSVREAADWRGKYDGLQPELAAAHADALAQEARADETRRTLGSDIATLSALVKAKGDQIKKLEADLARSTDPAVLRDDLDRLLPFPDPAPAAPGGGSAATTGAAPADPATR